MIRDGILLTANLDNNIVAYQAKHSIELLDLAKIGFHERADFFTPITRSDNLEIILKEGEFYILPSYEHVKVPLDYAAEMIAYDIAAGEFRSHYAGFFDPGWGIRGGKAVGAPAVLEVRPHQDGLILRHGQPICAMAYEVLSRPCTHLYGDCGNTYTAQEGPRLSKHFACEPRSA